MISPAAYPAINYNYRPCPLNKHGNIGFGVKDYQELLKKESLLNTSLWFRQLHSKNTKK